MHSKKILPATAFFLFLTLVALRLPAQSSGKFIKQMEQDSFTLYFALPVSMKAEEARVEFEPDFTYHAYEAHPERDQVTMNFSLFTKKNPVKEIDRIELRAGDQTFTAEEVTFLYLEKNGRKWHTRFTSRIPVNGYQAVLRKAESASFLIHAGTDRLVFPGSREWRKSAEIVREYLANQ